MGLGTFTQPLNLVFLVFRFPVSNFRWRCCRCEWRMQERALGQAMGLHVGGWPLGPWALRAEHAGPIRTRGLGRENRVENTTHGKRGETQEHGGRTDA